jgi:hypothetical protein
MASYFRQSPGIVVGEVWQVFRNTVGISERFADGLATETELK